MEVALCACCRAFGLVEREPTEKHPCCMLTTHIRAGLDTFGAFGVAESREAKMVPAQCDHAM